MELWDLYDKERRKLGLTMKRGDRVPDGMYHLVVFLCLFNSSGEMLIQRRQTFKEGWSGMWDVTVGGSAVAGDTSAMAIERELYEELGIKLSFENKRPVLTSHFDDGFGDLYVEEADISLSSLTLQESEVMDAKWATREEIMAMIDDGSFIPYAKCFIDLIYHFRTGRSLRTERDHTKINRVNSK